VFLKDGTHMKRTVQAGRGNEKDFATEADIVEKFEKLATHVLPRKQVEQIRDWMLNLESQTDASELARLLAKKA
jgi:aconitate decarboxylase